MRRFPSARLSAPTIVAVAVAFALVAATFAACDERRPATPRGGEGGSPTPKPGQTEFETEEPGIGGRGGLGGASAGASGSGGASAGAGTGGAAGSSAPGAGQGAPGGRTAAVEEGDIYRVDGNRLFYFNTYRGLVVYDLTDPAQPQRIARLPVFGYPVEMFVSGNTVHALLRDALYITQVGGEFQYQRHNVSQLVTIDVSDARNPRVVSTLDIKGQLREGVSRKVEDTIYVVSYFPQSYYWGWRPEPEAAREQAWVYSFNVADPARPVEKARHKIFEGGSVNVPSSVPGGSLNRSFSSVAISATANALMVVENWAVSLGGGPYCDVDGFAGQQAVVSLIDISDPQGSIAEHARFETRGQLTDQFKMTYVHDAAAGTGTFYGIFARQEWSGGCWGARLTRNTLESWDVSQRGSPRKLDALDFGKPNETVRGSAFDVERKVVYAITAERADPLYALGFADRADLRKLSEIDGLSGDMSVFRLVGDRNFLLAVGQDDSETCAGLQVGGRTPTRTAASLIDVRDLTAIRLVQRQCVTVEGADWSGSAVSNDLDQAHKLLGMHADGALNLLTIPIHYGKRIDTDRGWWGYRYETAVGLMTWDLGKYDPARPATAQQVFESFGTFVHPYGEVRRSILFRHQGTGRRTMINLSDTHLTLADIEDLRRPSLQATVELAPYYNQVFRFGDHLVEQVQSRPSHYGSPSQELAEFRIKRAGGELDGVAPVATFTVGQLQRAFKLGDRLVLFRQKPQPATNPYQPQAFEAVVMDLSDPARPRRAGRVDVPSIRAAPYYHYWCGGGAYWGSHWFDQPATFALTDTGIAFAVTSHDTGLATRALVYLDLRDPDMPRVSQAALAADLDWGDLGLVADPVAPSGFYLTHRHRVGEARDANGTITTRYRYYAQRWQTADGALATAGGDINIPGRLVRTFTARNGDRMFLAQDHRYRWMTQPYTGYRSDVRLSLLRQVSVGGRPAAAYLDGRVLDDVYPSALMLEGDRLVMSVRPQSASSGYRANEPPLTWEQASDRLLVFDLAGDTLALAHDKPTRMYGLTLMGSHGGKLFVNVGPGAGYHDTGQSQGDGILVVDVATPATPRATRFLRTLGHASHIEFFDREAYVASGHFGLVHLDLEAPSDIPIE
jgi:hypothetical protein